MEENRRITREMKDAGPEVCTGLDLSGWDDILVYRTWAGVRLVVGLVEHTDLALPGLDDIRAHRKRVGV